MKDEGKPVEIEWKLVLPGPEAESAVVACLQEHGYGVEALDPVRNLDTYLDTFDWSLMKNKLALRYRVSNGTAMYTLKSIEPIEDGIAKRMETEILLDDRSMFGYFAGSRASTGSSPRLLEQIQIRTDRSGTDYHQRAEIGSFDPLSLR
jgi:inorganic triphosphatase YgiF